MAKLNELAAEEGVTAGQLALAWVHRSDDVVPIPGTRRWANYAKTSWAEYLATLRAASSGRLAGGRGAGWGRVRPRCLHPPSTGSGRHIRRHPQDPDQVLAPDWNVAPTNDVWSGLEHIERDADEVTRQLQPGLRWLPVSEPKWSSPSPDTAPSAVTPAMAAG
ncbi:hypothetical protein CG747_42550 [Streptomyces sp. CB02959]|nr:hypothetical protein CG747_42550 [Streptomyces sp. CB02959]